ncbi:MAG TPA: (Fe-S)-binding protein [Anaerolineae bacterium]|nr:(Fe-S)-binding protein [Anaerolineae bacterium]
MDAGLDKVEGILEKEVAIVDGIDISGPWNRMFEQRVIWEYTPELIEKIASLPGAESFAWCYQCAKCVPVCPVDQVGDYGPRKLYRMAQTGVDLLNHDALWLCTTCMNCVRVCKKVVDMVKIMPAAREQAVLNGFVPEELQTAFENTAKYGNPLGQSQRKRAAWTKKSDVPVPIMKDVKRAEVLWYVGSYPSYHPRGIDASLAAARIFNALGVDFAILGREEKDDGDSQRLAGELGLFEMLAEHNLKVFEKYDWDLMVVTGPHEYNAFKKEYKERFGFDRPIQHYTQFLADRLDQLKPMLKHEIPLKVTFHDPCYLGRHHGEYDAPRALLQAIPGLELVEMGRCRENGYCCGGGGGGMWLDSFTINHTTMRLSERRVLEAVAYGADVLAVCCPFEVSRFEDAAKSTGNDQLKVLDILELLDMSMRGVGLAA